MRSDKKVAKDEATIDEAIESVLEVLGEALPESSIDVASFAMARKTRLDAARALVPLLERKAKLLGLDAPEQKPTESSAAGTLAELERKLALVPPGKAS